MSDTDRNYSTPSCSLGKSDSIDREEGKIATERGPCEDGEPKSAIDVAIELIEQAELEAINAARIAALNKPKPRGRPPLHRKIAENATSVNSKPDLSEQRRRKELARTQLEAMRDSPILPDTQIAAHSPAPIVKDHLEIEDTALSTPIAIEVSLFTTDNCEQESTDDGCEKGSAEFDKMILLNYGSTDGRVEEDEEEEQEDEDNKALSEWMKPKSADDTKVKAERQGNELEMPATSSPEQPSSSNSNVEQPSSPNQAAAGVKSSKRSTLSVGKDDDDEYLPTPTLSKRKYERKARGRPKKNNDASTTPKIGRPRGRPRKEGAEPVRKVERKSVDSRSHERFQKHRPRRAAAMIQDFLELYAKVDLADLEFVHTRATTFVKMLVDEYMEENKVKAPKSPRKRSLFSHFLSGTTTNSSVEAITLQDLPTTIGRPNECPTQMVSPPPVDHQRESESRPSIYDHNPFSADVDAEAPMAMDESGDEGESSGEDVSPDFDYDSNSDPSGYYKGEDDLPLRPRQLSDSFIDSIPVIRGSVLQPMPAVVDSA
ncbi:hypothetical protein Q1695_009773 [Nippostrongylus brasiliensis]|nr:hypothetical protein Q1695_009773 [Nippostrongylus brasiliensis]